MPEATAYVNTRVPEPDPDEYSAAVSVVPVSSVMVGVPVTVTASENVTRMSIRMPVEYRPSAVFDVTPVTVGVVAAGAEVDASVLAAAADNSLAGWFNAMQPCRSRVITNINGKTLLVFTNVPLRFLSRY